MKGTLFCDWIVIKSMQGLDLNIPGPKVNDKALQMEGFEFSKYKKKLRQET